ncbi:hypothetical protein PENTCL1PPCAC_309 [Pristionchus entomophagus]|uniref:EndoU domain-containing protein n=1 Tax=Pristionchus entomophagus TaxID=358040 RepID=A0AAV5SAG9_9BILA|nr:hypothetical protein PENTCL1PPCAC_309 [Pristionchus entomophagus]
MARSWLTLAVMSRSMDTLTLLPTIKLLSEFISRKTIFMFFFLKRHLLDIDNGKKNIDITIADFTKIDSSLLANPIYAAFAKLFNNYNAQAGIKEPKVSTMEEQAETKAFLDEIEQTKPFKTLLKFLKARNHPFGKSSTTLKEAISRMWFDRYSRSKGVMDTSGFEHVFVGETRPNY